MAENPTPPSTASDNDQNLKSLLVKGLVGAASLAGATAIPLLVQRAISPSPSVEATPTPPAQVVPAQAVPTQNQFQSTTPSQELNQADEQSNKGKGKKKAKQKD